MGRKKVADDVRKKTFTASLRVSDVKRLTDRGENLNSVLNQLLTEYLAKGEGNEVCALCGKTIALSPVVEATINLKTAQGAPITLNLVGTAAIAPLSQSFETEIIDITPLAESTQFQPPRALVSGKVVTGESPRVLVKHRSNKSRGGSLRHLGRLLNEIHDLPESKKAVLRTMLFKTMSKAKS